MLPDPIKSIEDFNLNIERLVIDQELTYMEALVKYCESVNLEYDIAAKQLSGVIKEKIRREAIGLHLLKDQEKIRELPL